MGHSTEKKKESIRDKFPRVLPILFFLILAIVPALMPMASSYVLDGVSVNYTSDNVPPETGTQGSGSQAAEYRYYLDISPSMLGYAAPEGRMSAVGRALLTLSHDRGGNPVYYTYANTVENVTESQFFGYMESTGPMTDYYNNALTDNTLADVIQEINPCNIFIRPHGDNQTFSSSGGMVNVIVTDLNFLKAPDDLDDHNALMEDFAGYLAANIADCNFNIYRILSTHVGPPSDEYNPNDAQTANQDDSFFIIVLAQNDRIYSQYIRNLEDVFARQDISLTEYHQLLNDPVGDNHTITLDRDSDFFQTSTLRTGLHWDNQSFRKLPDNAVGFHMAYSGDELLASLRIPVTKLSLPGYGDAEDGVTSDTRISTIIKAYQNKLLSGWEEDSQFSGLVGNSAYMRGYGTDWYLDFSMDLEKYDPAPDGWANALKLHHCVLLDVRFQLDAVSYSVPKWVEDINATTLPTGSSYSEKISISDFIQTLNDAKAAAYDSQTDSYQRYLGNLLILINY